jgi:formamidopyrimidine-DNA glycosylase
MPELAEVEYYRKCWDCGRGQAIVRVQLHAGKRLFRGVVNGQLRNTLPGAVFTGSEARGKQLLFRFGDELWLGLHLGMTGKLIVAAPEFRPGKHDHLVLFQLERALVFNDPRQFGRVQFACQPTPPAWWEKLSPAVNSRDFTKAAMRSFLRRHRRLPIKATLLLQSGFPGIGNWMADEILWRAQLHPLLPAGSLSESQLMKLWRSLRFVCRGAMKHVSKDFSDPPRGWLFNERWDDSGRCPIHRTVLNRETIGGRTTAWCSECQRLLPVPGRAAALRLGS